MRIFNLNNNSLAIKIFSCLSVYRRINIIIVSFLTLLFVPIYFIIHFPFLLKYWIFYFKNSLKRKKIIIISFSTISETRFTDKLINKLKNNKNFSIAIFCGFRKLKVRNFSNKYPDLPVFPYGILPLTKSSLFLTTKSSLLWNKPLFTEKVYIFHSPSSVHMYPEYSFDFINSFFVNGPHQEKELNILMHKRGIKKFKVFKVGSEVIDKIFNAKKHTNSHITTVLYAPTLGDKSSLVLYGKEIIKTILDKKIKIIFRPSPSSFFTHIKLINTLNLTFNKHPNFIFDDGLNITYTFNEVDVLITDWSGIGFEFAIGCQKPVIYIDTPPKVYDFNKNWKNYFTFEAIEITYRNKIGCIAQNPDNISKIIDDINTNYSEFSHKIDKYTNDLIYNLGNSSEYSYNAVLNLVKLKI